jgi:DNA-binding TFAR19-related protein (PDSD5 family)
LTRIADPELRERRSRLVDIRLAERAIARKNIERMIELTRTGEFDHIIMGKVVVRSRDAAGEV